MLTNHSSQAGRVLGETKAFEKNVSGNRMRNEMPCTEPAVRAMTPKKAKIQLIAQAQTTTSSPPSAAKP